LLPGVALLSGIGELMTCFRRVLIFLPVLLLLFSLSSCGWVKRTQVKSAVDEAHQKLRSGDFQNASDTYQLAYEKYPKDSEVLKNFVETIESIKAQGDKAFDTKDFVQAQITYDLLLKNFPRFSDFANLLSFKENFLATRLRMSRMLQAEKQAQYFLKSGDFQKGIDTYRSLIQQYPSDTTVRNCYISLLESIKGQADIDLKRKDFAPAGRTYRILLKNYSSLSNLKRFLSYDAGLLDAGIKTCRKILFEDGLKHYRSGNLSQAISIWENILTFDSENLEVKKASDMATLQSGNLKKIKLDDTK
jgi:tetratricopeptide (TPR) repeat protein